MTGWDQLDPLARRRAAQLVEIIGTGSALDQRPTSTVAVDRG